MVKKVKKPSPSTSIRVLPKMVRRKPKRPKVDQFDVAAIRPSAEKAEEPENTWEVFGNTLAFLFLFVCKEMKYVW